MDYLISPYYEFLIAFLILKVCSTILVSFLMFGLIKKDWGHKDPLISILIALFTCYLVAIFSSLIGGIFLFFPDWRFTGDIKIKEWFTIFGNGLSSSIFLLFSIKVYYEDETIPNSKMRVFYIILLINITAIILTTIMIILDIPYDLPIYMIGISVLIVYILSINGWIQVRINLQDNMVPEEKEYKKFIRKYNLIGIGKISIIIGLILIFLDTVIPKTVPNTFISFMGWIISLIGFYCFYYVFGKRDKN